MLKNSLIKSLLATLFILGISGCDDANSSSKNQENKSNVESKTNESKDSNPLDSLTATLPAGISANEAKKITNEATQKLFNEYFVNGAGKVMLENSIKIINSRIEKLSQKGVYDGVNLNTFMAGSAYGTNPQSDLRPMIGYLNSMNDEQKELYKRLIVNYYVQKGYKVVEGQQNYTDYFHYSINW